MDMKPDEFRKYVLEAEEPEPYTADQAYEAGKRCDMKNYDRAGCKCAKVIYAYYKKHPEEFLKAFKLHHKWMSLREQVKNGTRRSVSSFIAEFLKIADECGFSSSSPSGLTKYGQSQRNDTIEECSNRFGHDVFRMCTDILDTDPDVKKAMDEIGPTGFMWAWAFNAALKILLDEKYLVEEDDRMDIVLGKMM